MLVVNFILIDKPYRFFSKNSLAEFDDSIEKDEDVTANFTDANNVISGATANGVATSQVTNNSQSATLTDKVEELDDREKVFPALSNIDAIYDSIIFILSKWDKLNITDKQIYMQKIIDCIVWDGADGLNINLK